MEFFKILRYNTRMKKIVVLYHDNCPDGFGAAYAAWKKFGSQAEYIACGYDELPPASIKNKIVFLLDFSYTSNIIKKLVAKNKKVTIIDHHVSRKEDIKAANEWHYALKHSGAALTWLILHPKEPIPQLIKHIEDMDLWRFRIPHTDAIISIIGVTKWHFKTWDQLAKDLENPKKFQEYLKNSQWVMKANEKIRERIMKNTDVVEFAGYRTYAVNSPVFNSEIGHLFYKKLPPIGIVWKEKNGKRYISLRSDGTVDVSKIAKKFPNGGGHKTAAAFTIPASRKLPWKIIKK